MRKSARTASGWRRYVRIEVRAPEEAPPTTAGRAFSLPSATVDAAGTVYAAWLDCDGNCGECVHNS